MAVFRVEWALLMLAILKISFSSSKETCKKLSVCSCELSNGQTIDLKPLDGTATKPGFTGLKSVGSDRTFDWNPCTPFKVAQCDQEHLLVVQLGIGECFAAGSDDTSFSVDSTGNVVVAYGNITSGSGLAKEERSTKITLKCDPKGSGKGNMSLFQETRSPELRASVYVNIYSLLTMS